MSFGYTGKVLRVNLSNGTIHVEEPLENFYRQYIGGRGFISYFLLKELSPGVSPLSPENKLIFACGPVNGIPLSGCGRNSVGAKSPLTNTFGDAEVGGYWGAELKKAGYDAIIVEGKAEKPVYLLIKGAEIEIRSATHLWGRTTGESQDIIRRDCDDLRIRTALIGPAGENLVRYACILNDLSHAAGRTGMGAVMGSKNLKAIAVRGYNNPSIAKLDTIEVLSKWVKDNIRNLVSWLTTDGTASVLLPINEAGALPTRNFQESFFERADRISGDSMTNSILINRGTCAACSVRCKRIVKADTPYPINPVYGGPEYETLASFGSNCGIDDLVAIAKANELCNAYGLDTISTGATIAFGMECFQHGFLTEKDTNGVKFTFGNAPAVIQMIELIAQRKGIGDLFAEGVAIAAKKIGRGAEGFAIHVKGQEVPMHEPRYKQGMGLGYAVSPTGADHSHNIHDDLYAGLSPQLEDIKALGILEQLPVDDLSPSKVRMLAYHVTWLHLLNCLVFCRFIPFNLQQIEELVKAVTGWNISIWELMKVGERCLSMTRAFNIREGLGEVDDSLPERFFTSLGSGPLKGVCIDKRKFIEARRNFYRIVGWDGQGVPTIGKLQELNIEWIIDCLK